MEHILLGIMTGLMLSLVAWGVALAIKGEHCGQCGVQIEAGDPPYCKNGHLNP